MAVNGKALEHQAQPGGLINLARLSPRSRAMYDQNASSFLLRFPAEIRQMILKLVLGNRHIHIQLHNNDDRISAKLIYHSRSDTDILDGYAWYQKVREAPIRVGQVHLTCRQLYCETKHLFYASNIFAVKTTNTFPHWKNGLAATWSNAIRRLVLAQSLAEELTKEELEARWQRLKHVYLVFRGFRELPTDFPRNAAEEHWREKGVTVTYYKPRYS